MVSNELSTPDVSGAIEQVWYTWSSSGLGPTGFGVRAASENLRNIANKRMRVLDNYLRYELPSDTDPYEMDTSMAPICLTFLRTEQHESILVQKVYVERDEFNRRGVLFSHLLAGLPDSFSAADAIALWRSRFWQTSDPKEQGTLLPPLTSALLLQEHAKRTFGLRVDERIDRLAQLGLRDTNFQDVNRTRLDTYLPIVIQMYLQLQETRERGDQKERIYIAASADEVAYFIFRLTRCLPSQFLKDFTFSTFEANVLKAQECLVVGTCLPPAPRATFSGAQSLLPDRCDRTGLALNCYTGTLPSRLQANETAANFAHFAAQSMQRGSTTLQELLADAEEQPALAVQSFLSMYKLYEKLQHLQPGDVEEFFRDPPSAYFVLRHDDIVHPQVINYLITIPKFGETLKEPARVLFEAGKQQPQLASVLTLLAEHVVNKIFSAAEYAQRDTVVTLLNFLHAIQPPTSGSNPWQWLLLDFHKPPQNAFLDHYWDVHVQLLRRITYLWEPQEAKEIARLGLLDVPPEHFGELLECNLNDPLQYYATRSFLSHPLNAAAAQKLFEASHQVISDYLGKLLYHAQDIERSSFISTNEIAVTAQGLFAKLADANYGGKMELLQLWLGALMSANQKQLAISNARLTATELVTLLSMNGLNFLHDAEMKPNGIGLFKQLAQEKSPDKMRVLSNLLHDSVDQRTLEDLLTAAELDSDELAQFFRTRASYMTSYPESRVLLALFNQFARAKHPDKMRILSVLLRDPVGLRTLEKLLTAAELDSDEIGQFFRTYASYVRSYPESRVLLALFEQLAQANHPDKMEVFSLWYPVIQNEAHLREVLSYAQFTPAEAVQFFKREFQMSEPLFRYYPNNDILLRYLEQMEKHDNMLASLYTSWLQALPPAVQQQTMERILRVALQPPPHFFEGPLGQSYLINYPQSAILWPYLKDYLLTDNILTQPQFLKQLLELEANFPQAIQDLIQQWAFLNEFKRPMIGAGQSLGTVLDKFADTIKLLLATDRFQVNRLLLLTRFADRMSDFVRDRVDLDMVLTMLLGIIPPDDQSKELQELLGKMAAHAAREVKNNQADLPLLLPYILVPPELPKKLYRTRWPEQEQFLFPMWDTLLRQINAAMAIQLQDRSTQWDDPVRQAWNYYCSKTLLLQLQLSLLTPRAPMGFAAPYTGASADSLAPPDPPMPAKQIANEQQKVTQMPTAQPAKQITAEQQKVTQASMLTPSAKQTAAEQRKVAPPPAKQIPLPFPPERMSFLHLIWLLAAEVDIWLALLGKNVATIAEKKMAYRDILTLYAKYWSEEDLHILDLCYDFCNACVARDGEKIDTFAREIRRTDLHISDFDWKLIKLTRQQND